MSPETVPLCRRCHRTYHDWGIGAFSPDTTDRALELENNRREIVNKVHGYLPPMKLEDIDRSRYWYKKHGITPPSPLRRRGWREAIPFRIPSNPLCGQEWLSAHLTDHTPEEIEALTIEIGYDSQRLATVSVADKKGTVKEVLRQRSKGE